MEIMSVIYFVTVNLITVNSAADYGPLYEIDLPSCWNCSNQANVPCVIQQSKDISCLHSEFGTIWPGSPTDLVGRVVEMKKNVTWAANITWKPPYDASYSYLNGFHITVNIVTEYGPGSPQCFFANLSGTNWSTILDPHSLLFHFDCVTSAHPTKVLMTLKSSPVPAEKAQPLQMELILPGQHRDLPPPGMSINFTVTGTGVKVLFGPVDPDVTYIVCLVVPPVEFLTECERKLEVKGSGVAEFEELPVNTKGYQILISDPDKEQHYLSKQFNITGKEPPEQDHVHVGHVAILSITIACLMFISGGTTLCFCIMRKRGHCISLFDCHGNYSSPPETAPNNTHAFNEDAVPIILPLHYYETVPGKGAVSALCAYINKTTCSKAKLNWTDNFLNENIASFKGNNPNCILLILITPEMESLLKHLDSMKQSEADERSLCFHNILTETEVNDYRQILVSLLPLKEDAKKLKHMDIFSITKHKGGQNTNELEINTTDICDVLKMVNNDDNVIQRGLASYDDLQTLLNYIKEVDLDGKLRRIERDYGENFNHYGRQNPLTSRLVETSKWATAVSQQIPAETCYSYEQNARMPYGTYYPMRAIVPIHGCTFEGEDIESASMYHESSLETRPISQECSRGCSNIHAIEEMSHRIREEEWTAPEWDTESTTCSHLEQRHVEINENYMRVISP